MPQEQPNTTVMLVPDVNLVSNSKDEEIVDLEAIARLAKAKLEEDLAKVKTWNDEIAWKKPEQANCLAAAKKKKDDEEVAEVKWKADEAKKKVLVPPPVSFFCLSSLVVQKLTWFPVWAGRSAQERNGRAIQAQGEWASKIQRWNTNVRNRNRMPLWYSQQATAPMMPACMHKLCVCGQPPGA